MQSSQPTITRFRWSHRYDNRLLGLADREDEAQCRSYFDDPAMLQQAPQHPFKDDVIFVCIDAEGHCDRSQALTEVGWSVLDTRKLVGQAPGDRGRNWFKHIKSEHFRIIDNWHSRHVGHHGRWCKCLPDSFAFAKTRFHTLEQFKTFIDVKMQNLQHDRTNPKVKRNIVLLVWAHDMEQRVIQQLGHIKWLNDAHKRIDMQQLPPAQRYAVQQAKQLARFSDFHTTLGLPSHIHGGHELFHNGGNDAAFEMQAFLACSMLTRDQFHDLSVHGEILPEHAAEAMPVHYQEKHLTRNQYDAAVEDISHRAHLPPWLFRQIRPYVDPAKPVGLKLANHWPRPVDYQR